MYIFCFYDDEKKYVSAWTENHAYYNSTTRYYKYKYKYKEESIYV
jgi:hypothetical protein